MKPRAVLLVDANSSFREYAARFLADADPDLIIIVADLSDQAETLAMIHRPDIVLLGLSIFAQPGLRLLPRLRAALPDTLIIVMGVLEVNGYVHAALAGGADAFLLKDDLLTTLLPTITNILRRHGMG